MTTIDLPRILPYQPVRMSVARYHQLTKAGAFTEHDEVELLDGVVTEKMSKNPPHRIATRRCDLAFSKLVPDGWHVQNQEPVTLQNSEPEPDVAIVRGQLQDYASRHPGPGEIAVVVEVSDKTLVTDRFKAQLYAAAGIPVYWIVNLSERVIEVYQEPTPANKPTHYATIRCYSPEEDIPLVIADTELARLRVQELLPSP